MTRCTWQGCGLGPGHTGAHNAALAPPEQPPLFVFDVMVEVVRTVSARSDVEAAAKVHAEIDAMPNLVVVGGTTRVTPGAP